MLYWQDLVRLVDIIQQELTFMNRLYIRQAASLKPSQQFGS